MRVVVVEARPLTLPAILELLVVNRAPREVAVVGYVVGHYKILLLLEGTPRCDSDQRDVAAESAPGFTCEANVKM